MNKTLQEQVIYRLCETMEEYNTCMEMEYKEAIQYLRRKRKEDDFNKVKESLSKTIEKRNKNKANTEAKEEETINSSQNSETTPYEAENNEIS